MWSGPYFVVYKYIIIIRYHHQINSLFRQAESLDITTFLINSSHNNESKITRDRRVVPTDMTYNVRHIGGISNSIWCELHTFQSLPVNK